MNAQSGGNTKRLANASRILGIMSFGLLVLPILILLYARFSGRYTDFAEVLSVGFLAAFLILGCLVVGIPGCIIALVTLIRIRRVGSDNETLRIVIIGLLLSGVGPAFVLIYLAFSLLFNNPTPPPVQITPSSIIPLSP